MTQDLASKSETLNRLIVELRVAIGEIIEDNEHIFDRNNLNVLANYENVLDDLTGELETFASVIEEEDENKNDEEADNEEE